MGKPKRQQRHPRKFDAARPARGRLASGLQPIEVGSVAVGCDGRTRYPSEPVAANAADALNWTTRVDGQVVAYECPGCEGWHVGTA